MLDCRGPDQYQAARSHIHVKMTGGWPEFPDTPLAALRTRYIREGRFRQLRSDQSAATGRARYNRLLARPMQPAGRCWGAARHCFAGSSSGRGEAGWHF